MKFKNKELENEDFFGIEIQSFDIIYFKKLHIYSKLRIKIENNEKIYR
jgi:hypothetical protein|tara:strand:- start:78 stop:221 length:144 start_codon:yes stop_codon:yes gene_type:complete